jgi:hypothetical protein
VHPNSGKPELSVVYLRFIFGYLRLFLRYPVDISDVSPDISVRYGRPSHIQADEKGGAGAVSLDLELLKPLRVAAVALDRLERAGAQDTVWLDSEHALHITSTTRCSSICLPS